MDSKIDPDDPECDMHEQNYRLNMVRIYIDKNTGLVHRANYN